MNDLQEQLLKEYAKILPAHDHYSGEHIYKERRMKLSDEEIESLFSFVKNALQRVAKEERNKALDELWNHKDIDSVFLEGIGSRNLRVIIDELKRSDVK